MRFKDKVVIITGAASGMGLLSAQMLAEEGAKVVLTDVNAEAVEDASASIRETGGDAIGVQVDVRDYAQIKYAVNTALEKYGRIDILLNYAGGAETRVLQYNKPFHEQPVEVLDWGLDVNQKGTVYFCHAVLGTMIEQQSGVIITLRNGRLHRGSLLQHSQERNARIDQVTGPVWGSAQRAGVLRVSRTGHDASRHGQYEDPAWPRGRAKRSS